MTYPNIALDTISEGQDSKEVTANNMAEAESPAALFGCRATTTTGLTFGYYGGKMWVDGVLTSISSGTLLLTGSTTNYVESTRAGVVSTNTTGFTAGGIPLYTISTTSSAIDTVTPSRAFVDPKYITHSVSISITTADVTLSAAQARCKYIILTGALTGDRNLIVPNSGEWVVINNTSGSFSVTVKTSAGTGATVDQGENRGFFADGTNVVATTTGGGGGSNSFTTIAVSGQSDIVADSSTDTLTLVAGSGITLTTNAGTDTLTITNSGSASNSFTTIAVSGQSDVVADSATDTLTLVAGSNITLTTNAGTDTITIAASGGGGGITLGTPQNSTSGTSIDFTSIPSGTKEIAVMFSAVSTNGTSTTMIQIGDSGGVENTGYQATGVIESGSGGATSASSTSGFIVGSGAASDQNLSGLFILRLLDSSTNTWVIWGGCSRTSGTVQQFSGSGVKSLSAELDRVRITTSGGDTFDAGKINISYS
jgi:hypothetical protein